MRTRTISASTRPGRAATAEPEEIRTARLMSAPAIRTLPNTQANAVTTADQYRPTARSTRRALAGCGCAGAGCAGPGRGPVGCRHHTGCPVGWGPGCGRGHSGVAVGLGDAVAGLALGSGGAVTGGWTVVRVHHGTGPAIRPSRSPVAVQPGAQQARSRAASWSIRGSCSRSTHDHACVWCGGR